MKKVSLQRHKFDAVIKLMVILALMIFTVALEILHSSLARDISLLIVGIISGKNIKFL